MVTAERKKIEEKMTKNDRPLPLFAPPKKIQQPVG